MRGKENNFRKETYNFFLFRSELPSFIKSNFFTIWASIWIWNFFKYLYSATCCRFLVVSNNCERWLLASSRLSLHMEQLGSHWTDFHEIWYLRIFRKSVEKIQNMARMKVISVYIHTHIHTHAHTYTHTHTHRSKRKLPLFLPYFEFSRQIFEKFSNIKFHENRSSGSRVVPYGMCVYIYIYMYIFRCILFSMRNVSDKRWREYKITHFIFSYFFFRKSCHVQDFVDIMS